jgi:hypothetical protein
MEVLTDFPKSGTTQKVKAAKMFCPSLMGLIAGNVELKIYHQSACFTRIIVPEN